jgi:hypothetical protein
MKTAVESDAEKISVAIITFCLFNCNEFTMKPSIALTSMFFEE